MIKQFKPALLFFVAMLMFAATAVAQQMPPIPVDKDVRIGKLPNGLTYYIRHNEKPRGQADFYIAQKVGSILEEENQRGLAHFLEHMCFNGTEHYPGSSLRDWLETIGVKFGANLNAYTGVDQTVYNISDVPVARQSVQDSVLLILHDWANALTLDPEEIDAERGVIHQEWRRSMQGTMRILENLLPVIYPNNRYGYRLPIGTMEVVDNFPPQALRDYYETWYRPDQQGVIVVGDIDVDYIEGKIKEMFSDIEMPENPKERVYFPVEDNEGTIFAIGSDPEQTQGIVDIMFKTDATAPEDKLNMDYLMVKYIENMIDNMLSQRLAEIGQQPDAPYAHAEASIGNFFLAKTKDMLDVEAVAKGDDLLPAFETSYRELLRAKRGGFTVSEYERARSEYLSRLERAYNSRASRENEQYVNEYVNHFIDNEPIPSIEDEYTIMSQIAPMIDVNMINGVLPELIKDDNRVIMVLAPQNDTFKVPTQAELEAVIAKVDAEDIEPYKDDVKEEPLIENLPAPGKVISIADNAQWDAKVVTLSNGVKVIVKPTEFKKDQILFAAVALGGTSVIGDDHAVTLKCLDDAMSTSGLGSYNNLDLQKYLQGKQVSVNLSISDYYRTLSGSSTVKDLPTLMELIYMNFKDYEITPDEFAATKSKMINQLKNAEAEPQYVWIKNVTEAIVESPASQLATIADLEVLDRDDVLNIVHNAMANVDDYTFIFVGDVDLDTLLPLLEQYIATIPGNPATRTTTYVPNPSREFRPGKIDKTATMKMETPQTYVYLVYSADVPFTAKNQIVVSAASQILSNRLLKKIREEMGAVYSIGASGGLQPIGLRKALIQVPFPMKPELKNEVLAEINKMVADMATNITDDELNPIKEYMVKNATEDREQNSAWFSGMLNEQLTGVDTFNGKLDAINSVTVQDVMDFMKDLVKQGNAVTVVLDPAE